MFVTAISPPTWVGASLPGGLDVHAGPRRLRDGGPGLLALGMEAQNHGLKLKRRLQVQM